MTIEELHIEFKISLDKVDSSAYPELFEEEIDYFLNEAQDRYVKTRYNKNNIYQKGFEEFQKRTDDLKNLVVTRFPQLSDATEYTSIGLNIKKADLSTLYSDDLKQSLSSDKYMFYIKSLVKIGKTNCSSWGNVKLIQQDDFSVVMQDPFNRPKDNKVLIFFENDNIYIWGDKSISLDSYHLTFIKTPRKMDFEQGVTSELSEHTHKEIKELAVTIALENLEQNNRLSNQKAISDRTVE